MIVWANAGGDLCGDRDAMDSLRPDKCGAGKQAMGAECKAEGTESVMIPDGMAGAVMGSAIVLSAVLRIGWEGAAMIVRRRGGQEPGGQSGLCPCRHRQIGNRHLDQQSQDGKPANQRAAQSGGTGGSADPGGGMRVAHGLAAGHTGEPAVAESRNQPSRAASSSQAIRRWQDDLTIFLDGVLVISWLPTP